MLLMQDYRFKVLGVLDLFLLCALTGGFLFIAVSESILSTWSALVFLLVFWWIMCAKNQRKHGMFPVMVFNFSITDSKECVSCGKGGEIGKIFNYVVFGFFLLMTAFMAIVISYSISEFFLMEAGPEEHLDLLALFILLRMSIMFYTSLIKPLKENC